MLAASRGIGGDQRIANLADVVLREHGIHPKMRVEVLHRQAVGADDDAQIRRRRRRAAAGRARFRGRRRSRPARSHRRPSRRLAAWAAKVSGDAPTGTMFLTRHVIAADALHERVERRDRRHDLDLAAVSLPCHPELVERYVAQPACKRESSASGRERASAACAARSEELHRVAVELEAVERAQRFARTAPSPRNRRLRRGRTRRRSRDGGGAPARRACNVASPAASVRAVTSPFARRWSSVR